MRLLLAGLAAYLAARLQLARRQASVDARTGLLTAPAWLADAARRLRPLPGAAVLMIDIDRFKQVNDNRGHLAGDAVIASVARTVRDQVRADDSVCRFGGDEFAVLLTGLTAAQAAVVGERLRAAVAEQASVTVSIGVATCAAGVRADVRALLDLADSALYAAKRRGGDTVVVSGEAGRQSAPDRIDA